MLIKFIYQNPLYQEQKKYFITQYCNSFKYTFSGLSLSNTLCELVARDFDNILKQKLKDFGIMFYQRYIDDCLIVSNTNIDQSTLEQLINEVITNAFYKIIYQKNARLSLTRTNAPISQSVT